MSMSDAHQDFIARVRTDTELRERLQADPLAVLQAEGFSDTLLPDLVRAGLITPDVQGYDSWTGSEPPDDGFEGCTGKVKCDSYVHN